jgi:hypothetical protein
VVVPRYGPPCTWSYVTVAIAAQTLPTNSDEATALGKVTFYVRWWRLQIKARWHLDHQALLPMILCGLLELSLAERPAAHDLSFEGDGAPQWIAQHSEKAPARQLRFHLVLITSVTHTV